MDVTTPQLPGNRASVSARRTGQVFWICILAYAGYLLVPHSSPKLTLDLSSSAPVKAVLFYDIGNGFRLSDSEQLVVTSSSLEALQELEFRLPKTTIRALRLDVLTSDGNFKIRNVAIRNAGLALRRVAPSDVLSLDQATRRSQRQQEVSLSISQAANHPMIGFDLHGPIPLNRLILFQKIGCLLIITSLLGALISLILWPPGPARAIGQRVVSVIKRVDSSFAPIGQQLSSPEFIRFDSYAIWFYSACVALFVIASLADLNGSSIEMYNSGYGRGPLEKTWAGVPRATRADEWGYSTPAILNQCLRPDRFEVTDSVLGGHSVALISNIPVRHFTSLFRPQYWAFFFLPVDYAFAVFWQAKALILLTGVFTWLLLVTRSTAWAITGSLWYFFSPFTQWAYSWPTGLPEMVGLTCYAMVLTCYISVGKNTLALVCSAVGILFCAIDCALCAYVPHLIPLFWLALFFLISWMISRRRLIFTRRALGVRLLAFALAVSVIAIVGLLVFRQLQPALTAIANTTYPGRRVFTSALTTWPSLTSHFMQWTDTEQHFPPFVGNLSEGSGFLWLAPATLFCLPRMRVSSSQKWFLGSLWLTVCFLVPWLLLHVPQILGTIFLLSKTVAARTYPALGLANAGIVMLTAASMRPVQFRDRGATRLYEVCVFALACAIVYPLLVATNQRLVSFFRTREVLLDVAVTAGLITLLMNGRKLALACALVIPSALVFGTVNPIQRGLEVITSSDLFRFVRQNPQLQNGKWIVFTNTVVNSGFVGATGLDVYTGTHYVPDIDHFPQFAAAGLDPQLLNKLGYLNASPIPPGEKMSAQFFIPVVKWNVSPADPILPKIGIKYVAFDQRPSATLTSGLVPVAPGPVDGFWLYRLQ